MEAHKCVPKICRERSQRIDRESRHGFRRALDKLVTNMYSKTSGDKEICPGDTVQSMSLRYISPLFVLASCLCVVLIPV